MNEVILVPEGLRTRSTPLWLDARRKMPLSFVSHAHGDHIGRHERAIGTAATLELMARRLPGARTEKQVVPYGVPVEQGPLTLELFPAGHILGSAQIRITHRGHRTVYTGDFNNQPSRTAEPLEVAECDTLIIESTFGEPKYRFPAKSEVEEQMVAFAAATLDEGKTPVFLAYALGKAQEAARILGDHGFRVRVHPDAWRLCEVYQAHGVRFPNVAELVQQPREGDVLVAPPTKRKRELLGPRSRMRTCFLSGWAMIGGAHLRGSADHFLPLSDHADFDGLLAYVEATGASRVLTTHGSAEALARELRNRGVDARPLTETTQLDLL